MNIIDIICEEIQSLVERQEGIYTIPELAGILKVYGLDEQTLKIYEKLLFAAYEENGDEGVEDLYKGITGIEIEHITKGRYMFRRLVNPDVLKQAAQNAKYALSDAQYGIKPKKYIRE